MVECKLGESSKACISRTIVVFEEPMSFTALESVASGRSVFHAIQVPVWIKLELPLGVRQNL